MHGVQGGKQAPLRTSGAIAEMKIFKIGDQFTGVITKLQNSFVQFSYGFD